VSGVGRRGQGPRAAAAEPAPGARTPAASGPSDTGIRDASGRLDERSKRIIEQLQEDGRRSYAAIARAVGLSEAATRLRVQRLLDEGVVQIAAVTRADAVGFRRQAMLGVRVEGDIRAVAAKLGAVAEAEYVVVCAGQYDILVELVCEDDEHLLRVIDDDVRSIPGVRSTETFVYLRLEKETYQWGTR
jgi:Lrp/AsnC family transcriptional regulator for asnA, asnC and gidA